MVLHVAEGILVSVHQDEPVSIEVESSADVKVARLVVLGQLRAEPWLVGALHTTSLQEPTPDYTCGNEVEKVIPHLGTLR